MDQDGFKIHIWCSNYPESFLMEIPKDLWESNLSLNIETNDIIRTLELEWNSISDEFQFTA